MVAGHFHLLWLVFSQTYTLTTLYSDFHVPILLSLSPWQNSIRHNLSLHSRFVRVQNEGTGKSSWWMLNPEGGKSGKSPRRRATSMDNNSKFTKSRGRAAKKKVSWGENNLCSLTQCRFCVPKYECACLNYCLHHSTWSFSNQIFIQLFRYLYFIFSNKTVLSLFLTLLYLWFCLHWIWVALCSALKLNCSILVVNVFSFTIPKQFKLSFIQSSLV